MDIIRIVQGSITEVESDALVVNLFEGVESPGGATGAVDRALNGAISELIKTGEITGKLYRTTLLHTYGRIAPRRVLIVGLGKSTDFDYATAMKVTGTAIRLLREKGIRKVTSIVHGAGIGNLDPANAARAVAEGAIIGHYRGNFYKTSDDRPGVVKELVMVEQDTSKIQAMERGLREGFILGTATNDARAMSDEPSNHMTPTLLAERARDVAREAGLGFEVLESEQMRQLGMGGLMGVAQGSAEPPKMVVMKYHAGDNRPTLGLVGKGLTFDTGGISIKPHEGMQNMKYDMSGGAAVIGAMKAVSCLKPNINVLGVVPATENMPSGTAYKPGDVIKCSNGKTVEIISTDAEGRMILADALVYAVKQGASCLVDVATLTGSCAIALGNNVTGIMGNEVDFTRTVTKAANLAGEKVWELPLPPEYKDQLKSDIADMKNCGTRYGGALTAGLFLKEFADDLPWVHMDIAGTSDSDSDEPYRSRGATGVGVRTMALLAVSLAESDSQEA